MTFRRERDRGNGIASISPDYSEMDPDPLSGRIPPVRIAIAADHAGYALKEALKAALASPSVHFEDLGTDSSAPVDYPDFAAAVAHRVASGLCDRGILICGTGIGMAMAANRVAGVRAAPVWSAETARLAREHNDANVLALGARVVPADLAASLVRLFLETEFAGGRHRRRVDKIDALGGVQGS
jgi:ribose 5-phosphate isomerase B